MILVVCFVCMLALLGQLRSLPLRQHNKQGRTKQIRSVDAAYALMSSLHCSFAVFSVAFITSVNILSKIPVEAEEITFLMSV